MESGPFHKGKPEHGYQLALTPREFFGAGVAATNAWARKAYGRDFDRLAAAQRVAAMQALETGSAALAGVEAKAFFDVLLTLTMEGYFADPIHGGNRGKAAWRMVGFPGLPAYYADKIAAWRGRAWSAEPQSIVDFS